MSNDAADGLERDLAALEPRLDKLRELIESDFYGWGAERDLAQERLDAGLAHVADARPGGRVARPG